MFPEYNQEEFVAIAATVDADSVYVVNSTVQFQLDRNSTSAWVSAPASTAVVWPAYICIESPKNLVHIIYGKSS